MINAFFFFFSAAAAVETQSSFSSSTSKFNAARVIYSEGREREKKVPDSWLSQWGESKVPIFIENNDIILNHWKCSRLPILLLLIFKCSQLIAPVPPFAPCPFLSAVREEEPRSLRWDFDPPSSFPFTHFCQFAAALPHMHTHTTS